jgi:pSer/pThr/pTyr-binding forkhead associated (FHA) protein
VIAGRHAGVQHAIPVGEPLAIGRSMAAGFSFPDDSFLSGSHFSIQVTDKRILLRDLGSTNGTFVNGQRVEEVNLRAGDLINAGSHEFRLAEVVEASSVDATKALERPLLTSHPFLRHIHSFGLSAYFLLDAACKDKIGALIASAAERVQCLYDGNSAVELAPWAPYLVDLPRGSKLAEEILKEGWGKGWASFFVSRHSFEDLRHHFRKFLMVKLGDGSEAYFRFYDPRVLRDFLPTSTSEELVEFFGPVDRWFIETKDPAHFLEIRCSNGLLETVEKEVTDPSSQAT